MLSNYMIDLQQENGRSDESHIFISWARHFLKLMQVNEAGEPIRLLRPAGNSGKPGRGSNP
jgi:hypothetical protein